MKGALELVPLLRGFNKRQTSFYPSEVLRKEKRDAPLIRSEKKRKSKGKENHRGMKLRYMSYVRIKERRFFLPDVSNKRSLLPPPSVFFIVLVVFSKRKSKESFSNVKNGAGVSQLRTGTCSRTKRMKFT